MLKILPWLLLLSVTCVSSTYPTPRLGLLRSGSEKMSQLSQEFQTNFYTQTLDHFNYRPEGYNTFQQRYIMNSKYWGGANTSSPIFVYLGAEGTLTGIVNVVGFMTENAAHFKALLVYTEHRYYGESMPFGSQEQAYRNSNTLGYFSSSQALADYAELITSLKANLSAKNCPVVVIGGSYGGMLASWFRLKYPHIAVGALASSAPLLYFEDITPHNGYNVVVTKDYQETSQSCYNTIKESWFEIDKIAAQPDGLKILREKFKICKPLRSSQVLKDRLVSLYQSSAQYNNPPAYPLSRLCDVIDGLPKGSDSLSRISAALNLGNENRCNNKMEEGTSPTLMGWTYQTCSEIVMPIGNGENDTMFQARPFNFDSYSQYCRETFGITPRPHWITTEFGGHNIISVLKFFGSNIIFSNGLRDPYSSGGVLENISKSIVAIRTKEGAHCLDLLPAQANEPKWLFSQRKKEIKIIHQWIKMYNDEHNIKSSIRT